MRTKYLFVRAVLFIAVMGALQIVRGADGSTCCDCPIPSVGIFDFTQFDANGLVPEGGDWSAALQGFLEGYAPQVRNDPVCSLHFTALALGAKYKDLVKGGFDPGNQAARGDFDYLVQGKITGGDGHYNLKVILADGTTAEHIWEVNRGFASPAEAKTAGINTGQDFASMFDKICEYWRKKRDENTENAVFPKLTIKPQKEKTNVGEPVSVEITAEDCDHSPLKNRKITLSSENGQFTPQTVTTDANGKATTQFKPAKAGVGTLEADINYTSIVKHKPKLAQAWKAIQIADPPSGVWSVTINVSEELRSEHNHKKSTEDGTSEEHGVNVVRSTASVNVLMSSEYDPTFKKFNSSEMVSFGGGGSFSILDRSVRSSDDGAHFEWAMGRREGGGTFDRTDFNGVSFEVGPDKAWINGTVSLKGSYDGFSYTITNWNPDRCCTRQDQTVEAGEAIEFGYGSDKIEIPVSPLDAKNGTYVFHLDKTDIVEDKENGGTETRTRTGTIVLQRLARSQAPVRPTR